MSFPYKTILFICMAAGVIIIPGNDLSARENCEKLSVAVMTDFADNLKSDETFNELNQALNSFLSGKKKIGKTILLTDLKNPDDKKCFDIRCAIDLCVKNRIDYLITIRIRKSKAVKMEDVNKYLMKKDSGTVYSISIRITDIVSKKDKQVYSENNITSANAKNSVKKIRASLNKYFKAIKLCSEDKQTDASSFLTLYAMSFSGAVIKPAGSYSDIADIGYGLDIRVSSYLMDMKEARLSLDINAAYLSAKEERIESAYFLSPQVLAGYSFSVTENFSIMPLGGAGYVFNLINGKKKGSQESSTDFYYNPAVSCGIEFSYNIFPGTSIIMSPSCTYFFEQNDSGMYLMVSAGYRHEF